MFVEKPPSHFSSLRICVSRANCQAAGGVFGEGRGSSVYSAVHTEDGEYALSLTPRSNYIKHIVLWDVIPRSVVVVPVLETAQHLIPVDRNFGAIRIPNHDFFTN